MSTNRTVVFERSQNRSEIEGKGLKLLLTEAFAQRKIRPTNLNTVYLFQN